MQLSQARWPKDKTYRERYFVPDLSPEQRSQLRDLKAQVVFLAESPHESEIAPDDLFERRPLCGKAGREWWKMVGLTLKEADSAATDLERLLELCRMGQLVVMNAVQYPLDPKIVPHYGEGVDPVAHLGFSKVPPASFKKLKSGTDVQTAIDHLRERLVHSSVRNLPVISLGNDAQWFASQALGTELGVGRNQMIIPHPSAWWRQGGKLRDKARGQLSQVLEQVARSGIAQVRL